jgi:hypothetical protein
MALTLHFVPPSPIRWERVLRRLQRGGSLPEMTANYRRAVAAPSPAGEGRDEGGSDPARAHRPSPSPYPLPWGEGAYLGAFSQGVASPRRTWQALRKAEVGKRKAEIGFGSW